MHLRKIILSLVLALATLTGVLAFSGSAEAATDHRACVTRGEYNAISRGMTQARLFTLLDGHGSLLTSQSDGYYAGEWVDGGYYDEEWVDDSYYDDETGEWVEDGYWEQYWVEDGYWDDYANWVSYKDTVRSFKKCASFGSGRIGINLDNYTSNYSGMRVYTKRASNPQALANAVDDLYSYYGSYRARGTAPQDGFKALPTK